MTKQTVLLAAGLLLAGCASKVQRFRYESLDLNMVIASKASVDKHCKKYAKHYDDGTPVKENDGKRIRCCYKPSRSGHRATIFVSEEDLDCIVHELCHADGKPARECHKVKFE